MKPQPTEATDHEIHRTEREDLQHIRSELTRYYPDIPDSHDDLREAIAAWKDVAYQMRSGDVGSAVSQRISTLAANHPMFRSIEAESSTDAFPDDCSECPHYGVRCPVVKDRTQKRRLERILDESETSEETIRRVRRFAIDNDCVVIPDLLENWTTDLQPVLHSGQTLLQAVEDLMIHKRDAEVVRRKVKAARRRGPSELDVDDGESDSGDETADTRAQQPQSTPTEEASN